MKTSVTGTLVAVAMAAVCSATNASAGTITSINLSLLPGNSTGTLGPFGLTPDPNNDNAAGPSANGFSYNIFFNSLGLLEVEFNTANSGGTTEYRVTQSFINNSGQTWSTFVFELGFGTGASFVRAGAADALDFDAPDNDPPATASGFSAIDRQADLIRWTGGAVPSIGVATFALSIDVPDNLQAANPFGVSRFTLRQTPNATAVPEPATLVLLGSGIAGLVLNRRRRGHSPS